MAGSEKKTGVRWDESKASTLEAKSCTVTATLGEVSLLFGPEQFDQIHFTNRIILNPFTAKQLSLALKRVIGDYEEKFGPLHHRPAESTTQRERKLKASSIFELVKGLDVSIGYEQSFKVFDNSMLTNRFLLGISKKEIAYKSHDRILGICERMNMPQSLMEVFRQCLMDVNYIHFGFEEDRDACLYKVYVEFWDTIREEVQATGNFSKPYILHLGFKWDPFDNERKTLTRYTWFPKLTGEEMIGRVSAIADPVAHGHLYETARDLINMALQRMSNLEMIYLEATEQGNPRKSFDINVYRGGLHVGEMYGLLTRLAQHYNLDHAEFHRFYNGIRTNRFGHLAGGTSREGKSFCTFYHGVESIHTNPYRQALPGAGSRSENPTPTGQLQSVSAVPADREAEKRVEQTDEQAARLLRMIKNLDRPFGLKRSFKIACEAFLPERFLAGFQRESEGVDLREQVLGICREICMPDDFLAGFTEGLPEADIIVFGFEKNQGKRLHKAYLEFADRLRKSIGACPATPEPFVMSIGFKWDIAEPARKALTKYTCFPACLLADIRLKAAKFFSGEGGTEPDRIVEGILELASHRAGPGEFLYYEAQEAGNERKSFSINLNRADLRMEEVYPLLLDMARYFHVSPQVLHRTYEASKNLFLGNIAGGRDRDGKDFLAVYYSERGSSGNRPGTGDERAGKPGRESGQ